MQGKKQLAQLLDKVLCLKIFLLFMHVYTMCAKVLEECKKLPVKPPLLVKIAPDLTKEDMEDIAVVVTRGKVCQYLHKVLHLIHGGVHHLIRGLVLMVL